MIDREFCEKLLSLAEAQGQATFERVSKAMINAASIDNGYAHEHGLPYPKEWRAYCEEVGMDPEAWRKRR